MKKQNDVKRELTKQDVYQQEFDKLTAIFQEVEEPKRKLIEGLVEEAAFLKAENYDLKKLIEQTGMRKVHPQRPDMQKQIPSAAQYLKNLNSYAIVIKTLNGILSKNIIDEDDEELEDYE
jgi:regulator of replication initiation timing